MKVKSESEVTQSCPTLSDPMDSSLPGSSVNGIFQARVLEWSAIAFSIKYVYCSINFFLHKTGHKRAGGKGSLQGVTPISLEFIFSDSQLLFKIEI